MRAWELIENDGQNFDAALRHFADQTKEELGLQEFRLYMSRGNIKLDTLIVGKDRRKEGVGSEAMMRLTRFADHHGKRIILSPAVKDTHHGTTSRSRLVKFYKQFGFKENKGRMKDFTISDSMIRDPSVNVSEARDTGFKIFCDMDGVLVNFEKGAAEFMADPSYGEEFVIHNFKVERGRSGAPFWKKLAHVNKIDPERATGIWANLEWMPDGKKLWDYISKYDPIILSSPGNMSVDIIVAGKKKWVAKHISNATAIYEPDKFKYAKGKSGNQHILIDDQPRKIEPWTEKGGIGILHINTATTIKELKKWKL